MSDWSLGYNVDVTYTHGFYERTMPGWLDFIARFDGVMPPQGEWRYLELGCGNGFGLILLAACYPDHDFVGIDFDPAHIAHGRELAGAAGLDNIEFIEADFMDLAQDWPTDWGQFDYVIAHGVISWISVAARTALTRIINHAARPGALVYLSYNSMPGQASLEPIQYLFRLWQKTEALPALPAITTGISRFEKLMEAGAGLTEAMPLIQSRIKDMDTEPGHYLVHEFLHDNWQALWFDQVADLMGTAKLSFIGSAEIGDRYPNVVLPANLAQMLDGFENPMMRQVMLDVIFNRRFRKDVFARGAPVLWPTQRQEQLAATRLCLGNQALDTEMSFEILQQKVSAKPATFQPLLALLAEGPTPLSDLMHLRAPTQKPLEDMKKTAMYLLQSDFAALEVPIADKAPAQRLNRLICERVASGAPYSHFIAPQNGVVLRPEYTELLMLAEIYRTSKVPTAGELAQNLVDRHVSRGKKLLNEETGRPPQEGELAYATTLATRFLSGRYPEWKTMGVL